MLTLSPRKCPRRRHVVALATFLIGRAAVAGDLAWTVTPYLWATNVGVDVAIDDRQVVDEEIAVTDLLEDLDTIAQVRIEVERGAHGAFVDLFDVTLSDDPASVPLPGGGGEAVLAMDMGMTILDAGGSYDPRGDREGFALLYGVRILDERADVDATFARGNAAPSTRHYEPRETLVDALVGVRYAGAIAGRLGYELCADASSGGTDYTWSVGPSLRYAFGKDGRHAATLGYRHMTVAFDDAEAVDAEMTLSGPMAGLRLSF